TRPEHPCRQQSDAPADPRPGQGALSGPSASTTTPPAVSKARVAFPFSPTASGLASPAHVMWWLPGPSATVVPAPTGLSSPPGTVTIRPPPIAVVEEPWASPACPCPIPCSGAVVLDIPPPAALVSCSSVFLATDGSTAAATRASS